MFYITTPIPYTNAQPHLGHLLEGVFNDTIARFYRRVNDGNVILTMGLDQHGLKIYEKAKSVGQEPREFAVEQGQKFKDLWKEFNVKYDSFIETTSPEHKIVSQLVWRKLEQKGLIYKKKYKGLYCKDCEDFYAPSQLTEDGLCPIHLTKPIEMSEENYFFKLSDFGKEITNFLETADIRPSYASKEQINFVKEGLQDISISREKSRLPWGIAVPGDENQVMYVWFEALINYLTGAVNLESVDKWQEFPELRGEIEGEIWEDIQKAMPIDLLYVGKEIAKFHLVIWIGMLLGLELPLPKRALVHGMINDSEGKKFSKSLGNGVLPEEMVERFGIDGCRFILLHEINVDGDTNFDWEKISDSYNSHLANNLGNLLMRVTNLVEKNLGGTVNHEKPDFDKVVEVINELDIPDSVKESFGHSVDYDFSETYNQLNDLNVRGALDVVLGASDFGNNLLEKTKPWTLFKDGKEEEGKIILEYLVFLLKNTGDLLSIFLPESGAKIYETVNSENIKKAEPLFKKFELE